MEMKCDDLNQKLEEMLADSRKPLAKVSKYVRNFCNFVDIHALVKIATGTPVRKVLTQHSRCCLVQIHVKNQENFEP